MENMLDLRLITILEVFVLAPVIVGLVLFICYRIIKRYLIIAQKIYLFLFFVFASLSLSFIGITATMIFKTYWFYNWMVFMVIAIVILKNFLFIFTFTLMEKKKVLSLILNSISLIVSCCLFYLIIMGKSITISIGLSLDTPYMLISSTDLFKNLFSFYIIIDNSVLILFLIKVSLYLKGKTKIINWSFKGLMTGFGLFCFIFTSIVNYQEVPHQLYGLFYSIYVLLFLLESVFLMSDQNIRLYMDHVIISDVIFFDSKGIVIYKRSRSQSVTKKFLQNSLIMGFSQLYSAIRSAESLDYIKSIRIDEINTIIYHFYQNYEIGAMIIIQSEYWMIKDKLEFFFKIVEKELLEKEPELVEEDKAKNEKTTQQARAALKPATKLDGKKIDQILNKVFKLSVMDGADIFT